MGPFPLTLLAPRIIGRLLDLWKNCVFLCETYVSFFMCSSTLLLSLGSKWGVRGGAFGGITALQTGRSRVPFPMGSLEFFVDLIRPAATVALGSTEPLKSEYQGCLLGVKTAYSLHTFVCRLSSGSGPLNLLEPYGPVHVCRRIALSFNVTTSSCPQPGPHPHIRNILTQGSFSQLLRLKCLRFPSPQ